MVRCVRVALLMVRRVVVMVRRESCCYGEACACYGCYGEACACYGGVLIMVRRCLLGVCLLW